MTGMDVLFALSMAAVLTLAIRDLLRGLGELGPGGRGPGGQA